MEKTDAALWANQPFIFIINCGDVQFGFGGNA
jgi:hypothetical protein